MMLRVKCRLATRRARKQRSPFPQTPRRRANDVGFRPIVARRSCAELLEANGALGPKQRDDGKNRR